MYIQVTHDEWDNRNEIESTIMSDSYALTELDWTGYSSFIDDELMYVFFIKNDLIQIDEGDVVAKWQNDDSMVVGVEVSLM